ncbi:MAG: rhodanese-like domain-containing protein [Woeseiaceae bacterium]
MPLDELEKGLGDPPSDKEIVAYCRSPYCLFAVEAVQALRARGLDARRLEVGFPDWRMLGLPVGRRTR